MSNESLHSDQPAPKDIEVLDKHGAALSPCTLQRAKQLVKRGGAVWIEEGVRVQLLLTREERREIRRMVLVRDNYICYICGKKMGPSEATVDHIISRAKGGSDLPENLAGCCRTCNNDKGNRSLQEYRAYLKRKAQRGSR